jgi:hypothetical protein
LPCRGVAHGDAYIALIALEKIKVISAVLTLHDVGGVHSLEKQGGLFGVVRLFPNYAFISPVRKVANGRRPTYVIVCAKLVAVKTVVTAIDIYPVAKNVRLAVGDIFIRW